MLTPFDLGFAPLPPSQPDPVGDLIQAAVCAAAAIAIVLAVAMLCLWCA